MPTPSQLLQLSRRLDTTLNEFGLTANAEGEYPWQTAQREKRNRRMVAGAAGAAAIGAGAYGAKKGMDALNKRYGTTGADGLKVGAADLIDRGDDAVKAGMQKLKGVAGQAAPMAKRAGAYAQNVAKAGSSAVGTAMKRGAMQKQGLGKRIVRAGGALIGAMKGVKFETLAPRLVELEKQLDERLQAFQAA